jgi:hypothetical protein
MKMTKFYSNAFLLIVLAFILSLSSCIVTTKHDNGLHKGWTKNTNNPHHPATTNPGHTKSVNSPGNSGAAAAKGNSSAKKGKK